MVGLLEVIQTSLLSTEYKLYNYGAASDFFPDEEYFFPLRVSEVYFIKVELTVISAALQLGLILQ